VAVALGAAFVQFRDVSFGYSHDGEVLDGVDLTVREGAVVGIVGPSGCGKSTLLSLIAGFQRPDAGELLVPAPTREQHPLAMVFQKDTLLPWLTVQENVALAFRFRRSKQSKQAEMERVRGLLDLAGLADAARKYPYQLSGGMRRRTAFLSAIAPNPRLVLLDEPFSSLDEPTRVGIHQSVHGIVRQFGTTVLLVTHDLAEAISLCDEVVILSARPARVVATHPMPFGVDRDMLALRRDSAFLEMYGVLWEQLSEQIRASRPAGAA
jgi:ABC-type nitrate/sulfonate/bicarbonate transport system ATPase subunit